MYAFVAFLFVVLGVVLAKATHVAFDYLQGHLTMRRRLIRMGHDKQGIDQEIVAHRLLGIERKGWVGRTLRSIGTWLDSGGHVREGKQLARDLRRSGLDEQFVQLHSLATTDDLKKRRRRTK